MWLLEGKLITNLIILLRRTYNFDFVSFVKSPLKPRAACAGVHSLVSVSTFAPSEIWIWNLNLWFSALPRECSAGVAHIPLHAAVIHGYADIVQTLLDAGCNVDKVAGVIKMTLNQSSRQDLSGYEIQTSGSSKYTFKPRVAFIYLFIYLFYFIYL